MSQKAEEKGVRDTGRVSEDEQRLGFLITVNSASELMSMLYGLDFFFFNCTIYCYSEVLKASFH